MASPIPAVAAVTSATLPWYRRGSADGDEDDDVLDGAVAHDDSGAIPGAVVAGHWLRASMAVDNAALFNRSVNGVTSTLACLRAQCHDLGQCWSGCGSYVLLHASCACVVCPVATCNHEGGVFVCATPANFGRLHHDGLRTRMSIMAIRAALYVLSQSVLTHSRVTNRRTPVATTSHISMHQGIEVACSQVP